MSSRVALCNTLFSVVSFFLLSLLLLCLFFPAGIIPAIRCFHYDVLFCRIVGVQVGISRLQYVSYAVHDNDLDRLKTETKHARTKWRVRDGGKERESGTFKGSHFP